eukprot:5236012-Amphidinium_carterae.1
MVDRSSFMTMLLHVVNGETETDNQSKGWQEVLTASGACNALGVVDVEHFVRFCLLLGVEGRLDAPSEPSKERLAATSSKPGGPSHPAGGDMSSSSWTLSAAWFGVLTPLPSLEDQAGAVVVVDSKQYVLGARLGSGAGGSVFATTLKRKATDVHSAADEPFGTQDPESMALKLVGGVDDAEFR